ncbi:hypothetical protein FHT00_002323 [Sphingomonas insulae]|nr:hypothetical protein [Sphingomonas insulae]
MPEPTVSVPTVGAPPSTTVAPPWLPTYTRMTGGANIALPEDPHQSRKICSRGGAEARRGCARGSTIASRNGTARETENIESCRNPMRDLLRASAPPREHIFSRTHTVARKDRHEHNAVASSRLRVNMLRAYIHRGTPNLTRAQPSTPPHAQSVCPTRPRTGMADDMKRPLASAVAHHHRMPPPRKRFRPARSVNFGNFRCGS